MMKRNILLMTISTLCLLAGCHHPHKFTRMAEETNKNCPMRLNETVTLDSTTYDEALNRVSYYYSVSGELDNPEYMLTNYTTFKQTLQEAIDNSIEMEGYRKANSSIRYVYFSASRQGEALAEFLF